ncbi:MAG: hypothetical protein SGI88_20250 [Candidatus Hydrogenedentes bacterium]|nr:hypothetical protein [Candidatus Hydrogenedentota bacterium]
MAEEAAEVIMGSESEQERRNYRVAVPVLTTESNRLTKKHYRKAKRLNQLERSFPRSSGAAFEAARNQTLALGVPVLEAKDGAVYRVDASGARELVKSIGRSRPVKLGTKIKLR